MPLCDYTLDIYYVQNLPQLLRGANLEKKLLKGMTLLHEDKTFICCNVNPDNSDNGNENPLKGHGIVHRELEPAIS